MNMRHILSTGLAALPENSNGVPFNCSHVYASGNIAADMIANVTAESSGRVLAVRLYNMTDDPGMKDMLSFLIARDTMHQQQWLAAIEEMGGLANVLPIPNSFPQEKEQQEFSYAYINTFVDGLPPAEGRWSEGASIDGNGEFSMMAGTPQGEEPMLAPARPDSGAQTEQMQTDGAMPRRGEGQGFGAGIQH
jgi:Mn-containing catalase